MSSEYVAQKERFPHRMENTYKKHQATGSYGERLRMDGVFDPKTKIPSLAGLTDVPLTVSITKPKRSQFHNKRTEYNPYAAY